MENDCVVVIYKKVFSQIKLVDGKDSKIDDVLGLSPTHFYIKQRP